MQDKRLCRTPVFRGPGVHPPFFNLELPFNTLYTTSHILPNIFTSSH